MRRFVLSVVLLLTALLNAAAALDELRFDLRSEPKSFNPATVADDSSETIRYMTGGVLVRLNRDTQKLEPELASAWSMSRDGKTITFTLRTGIAFSDGTPFSAADVKYTIAQLMDPALHSPTGDAFRSGTGKVVVTTIAPNKVSITFPAAVAGLDKLFDQVAIVSSQSPKKEMAALGPFYVAEYKPGAYVYLRRNPNYWKHDASGRQLPYLDAVKLEIQANRDIEFMRFTRNEIHLINSLDADYFDRLSHAAPDKVRDAGASLDSEQIWFNQVPNAPIASYKREWFQSRNFRQAISAAISRADLCKVVFKGHATPAMGPVSPANKFWFNAHLQPTQLDTKKALQLLQSDGFRYTGGKLYRDQCRQSRARGDGYHDSAGPARHRYHGECGDAGLPVFDPAHERIVQLRGCAARLRECRARSQRANECLVKLLGGAPVEPETGHAGHALGSGARPTDAGAGIGHGRPDAQEILRPGTGNRG